MSSAKPALGCYGYRIEPCGFCEKRAAIEQRADRASASYQLGITKMSREQIIVLRKAELTAYRNGVPAYQIPRPSKPSKPVQIPMYIEVPIPAPKTTTETEFVLQLN